MNNDKIKNDQPSSQQQQRQSRKQQMTAPKKQANKRADSLLAKQSQTNDELCDVYIEINQTGLHHKHVLRLRQHATDDC